MRNRVKTLKGDEDGMTVVMETGLYGNSLLFFPSQTGGWSADCVSVRGVCGYETSEKNNNTQARISIFNSSLLDNVDRNVYEHDALRDRHPFSCAAMTLALHYVVSEINMLKQAGVDSKQAT